MNASILTREVIKSLQDVETVKDEQQFNIGLKYGLDVTDYDSKSPWISVKDDLPCNHEELIENSSIYVKETKCVIACDNEHNIDFDYMVKCDGKWSWARNESNTHWFIIPKLPNK